MLDKRQSWLNKHSKGLIGRRLDIRRDPLLLVKVLRAPFVEIIPLCISYVHREATELWHAAESRLQSARKGE